MSFSSIAVQQREKEAKALKSFLAFSLIGSLTLHIGVLASGIGNLFNKLPSEEEPIEFTIVEPATLETPEPPEETKKETPKEKPIENTSILSAKATTDSNNNTEVLPVPKLPQPLVKVEKQPIPQPTAVVQKLQPEAIKEQPKPVVQQPENTPNSRPNPTTATNTSPAPVPVQNNTQPSNENLRQVLSGVRDSRNSQESRVITSNSGENSSVATSTGTTTNTRIGNTSGNSTSTGTATSTRTGNTSGNSTSTGITNTTTNSTNTGTSQGRQRQNVATAPTPPKLQTSSGNGRAACRQCDSKYPEDARRRGVEGRVEVAVDTDSKGNVTNVRILKSSGNRKLDEEHINQARNWKLKPSQTGRQGVAIATEYALQGSRRYRNVKKRQRQREEQQQEQQRNQQATSNSASTPQQTSRRRRRFTSGTIVDVPPEVRTRKQNTSTSSSSSQTNSNQTTTSQPTTPIRRLRRQRVETPSATTNQTTPRPRQQQQQVAPNNTTPATQSTRRRRREVNKSSGSSSNQTQLRQSLRRFKQQSAPVVPPASGNSE